MATFVSTVTFTDQGMKAIGESCQRAAEFRTAVEKRGVKVRELLWTIGSFDGLIVFEAPDGETAAAIMLKINSVGYVHTQTMRAYDANDMQSILAKS